jgi:hypothetical protein
MKNHLRLLCVATKGGHLFPLENPEISADTVKQVIGRLKQ